jgi:hypothetical protein
LILNKDLVGSHKELNFVITGGADGIESVGEKTSGMIGWEAYGW